MPDTANRSDIESAEAYTSAIVSQAEALLHAHGSPLYAVSEAALRSAYRAFARAFADSGIAPRIAYSYKTNYLPAVCAILHQEGAAAEVVSGMEYAFARALGVADIVFNGPAKTRAELETALGDGALVVVDGFDELDAVVEIAANNSRNRPCRIGLRFDLGETGAAWSRFGFRHDNGDTRRALERVAAAQNLRFELLHHHAGTDHRDPAPYRRAAQLLSRIRTEAQSLGLAPHMLDLGGGFPADLPVPAFAAAIAEGLRGSPPPALQIVVEPGRALIDPAMWLICTVAATKEIPGLGRAAMVDAGINLLPLACRASSRRIAAVCPRPGAVVATSVFGPLCMPEDRIAEAAVLPPLRPGDALVVSEAGAYTLTQSMEFSAPRPAVVLLGPDGPEIIRRREDWRDVLEPCELPDRLRRKPPAKGIA